MEITQDVRESGNPCEVHGGILGTHKIPTDHGLIAAEAAFVRLATGQRIRVAKYASIPPLADGADDELTRLAVRPLGVRESLAVRFSDGAIIAGTSGQRVFTRERGWRCLGELTRDDIVERAHRIVSRGASVGRIPPRAHAIAETCASRGPLHLPRMWGPTLCHYLGWLVGDGCLTKHGAVAVYGSPDDQRFVMPMHRALLSRIGARPAKPVLQSNGTWQLRLMRRGFVGFLGELGVSQARAASKVVPSAICEAPSPAVAAFLRGLFDADGCVVNQPANQTRYVGLGSASQQLLLDVQQLLACCFGIRGRIYSNANANRNFEYTRKRDGQAVTYSAGGPMYDLRISGTGIRAFRREIGFMLPAKQGRLDRIIEISRFYRKDSAVHMVRVEDLGRRPVFAVSTESGSHCVMGGFIFPGQRSGARFVG
ncbi:LAGLIDADG family homing endonuclease [Streptodolium elevatio]|uniref:LAGLIDADG family homing endonuclease n=1 Tax=Streptodolium elevatio TaxID=3157996 RepID=A0ABV3DQX7_9ACTN